MKWNPQHLTIRFPRQRLQSHWVMAARKTLYLHIPAIASLIFLNDIKAARCTKKGQYWIFARGTTESCPEERKKNKQEWATSNKLHVFRIKQKGTKLCHNKNKYININKKIKHWQDRIMYEQGVIACSHMHSRSQWPSWHSNSSQSHNIFLVPESLIYAISMYFSTLHRKTNDRILA